METLAAIGAVAGLAGGVFGYFTGTHYAKKKIRKRRRKEAAQIREAVGSGNIADVNRLADKLCRED